MDDSLKSNLTCPICLDLYNNPVALYCMHSFCRECLLETVRNRAPSFISGDTKVRVPCPNCKREFPLSMDGVRRMQCNFQLQSIVEGYKINQQPESSKEDPKVPSCDICKDEEGRVAVKRCTKCEVSYCNTCLEVYHPPRGPFATHKVTNIGSITGGATGGGARPIPAPKPKSSSVAPIKAQFRQDLEDLTKEADGVRRFVEDLKQTKSSLEKSTTDLKQNITNECSKLRDHITKTETEQRGAVLDESKQKMMLIEIQLREYQECLRKQDDVIDALRALLKEPDDQLFLKTVTSMKEKVKTREENKPQSTTLASNADLKQSTKMFQEFKQRGQLLLHGNTGTSGIAKIVTSPKRAMPPMPPPIKTDLCICQLDSITVCLSPPVYVGDEIQASKVDRYEYKYKKASDVDWKLLAVPIGQIESKGCIKIGSLSTSTQYNVSIRAHNSAGWSPWTTSVLLKTKEESKPKTQEAPVTGRAVASGRGAPRIDIARTQVGSEIVMLQWNPCQGMIADAHVVSYCTTDTGREDWVYLVSQEPDNSFVVTGLSPGGTYLFRVSSCSKEGFSDWSRKVKIKLGDQKLPSQQAPSQQETSFAFDKQTAHPCLLISGKSILHPSNACPSISNYFTDNCYSAFGTTTFNSRTGGVYYWEVIIQGEGSKVRIGVAEPKVNMSKPLGTCPDAWVLVMDARKPSNRQGSFVMFANHQHKSGGKWIPFTNYIGVQLDFNKKEVIFIEYSGPPTPSTPRTSHSFSFHPPDQLKPIFAIDEKTDDLKLLVVTDKKPPDVTS